MRSEKRLLHLKSTGTVKTELNFESEEEKGEERGVDLEERKKKKKKTTPLFFFIEIKKKRGSLMKKGTCHVQPQGKGGREGESPIRNARGHIIILFLREGSMRL